MVFEILEFTAEKRGFAIAFLYSFFVCMLSSLLAVLLFPSEEASLLSLFFITISFLPLFRSMLMAEEKKLENKKKIESLREVFLDLFVRNSFVIKVYLQFFFAVILSTLTLYFLLPESVSSNLFEKQITTINSLTGFATSPSPDFFTVFSNNFRVLTIAFLLSFFFGSEALFIIAWLLVWGFIAQLLENVLAKTMNCFYSIFNHIEEKKVSEYVRVFCKLPDHVHRRETLQRNYNR